MFWREVQLFGDELPCKPDRVALEVVSKREIAEHLEEGMMPRGVPDLLEIIVLSARAHALLTRRRAPSAGRQLLAEEHALELHHSRVGEQQRWIVGGHQRAARVGDVSVLLELRDELFADLGGFHSLNIRAALARSVGAGVWDRRGVLCAPNLALSRLWIATSAGRVRVPDSRHPIQRSKVGATRTPRLLCSVATAAARSAAGS